MTETRFTWRWLFVVAALGLIGGVVLGLIVGWVFPISSNSVDVSALNANAQNDYIVLVANSYAYDTDLDLARQRLGMLKDSNLKSRVERLAKSLSAKKDPDAVNVADLAVGLGSTDSALKVLAATVLNSSDTGGEPTKVAHVMIDATATLQPTVAATSTVIATAALAPTDTPAATVKAKTAAPKNTVAPKPVATNPPAPAAALMPEFIPGFPTGWWNEIRFVPASVAPGQQYWRLKYARYCDWAPNESMNPCNGFPGGIMDHTIYIMALDPSGACANNPTVNIHLNNGTNYQYGTDKAKTIPYAWYSSPCLTDWEKEMYGEGNDISIDGLPSDTITNLKLCSANPPAGYNPPSCGHAHVHYFLVFQQTTR